MHGHARRASVINYVITNNNVNNIIFMVPEWVVSFPAL